MRYAHFVQHLSCCLLAVLISVFSLVQAGHAQFVTQPNHFGFSSPRFPLKLPAQPGRATRLNAAASGNAISDVSQPNFEPAASYDSGGYETQAAALADVNADGKPDLVVVNSCSSLSDCVEDGSVAVMFGNGDGTFQPAVTYGAGGHGAWAVAAADVNGDGRPDLVVATGSSSVAVLLNDGDGTFQPAVIYGSGGFGVNSVAVADVNGDGKPDLLTANECLREVDNGCSGNGTVGVLLGNGNGTFKSAVTYDAGALDSGAIAVADVNGDGKPDLVAANLSFSNNAGGCVSVLLNKGKGKFEPAVVYASGGFEALAVVVKDVNSDGKPDIVVANQFASDNFDIGTVGVLLGNANGTFHEVVAYDSGGYDARGVDVADLNGDGKPDLVVANGCADSSCGGNGTWGILLNNGDGTFQQTVSYASGGDYDIKVVAGDLNGDGKPDVVAANGCAANFDCNNGAAGVMINSSTTTYSFLINAVKEDERNPNAENIMVLTLNEAQQEATAGRAVIADILLCGFIDEVNAAQSLKLLTNANAATLIQEAKSLRKL
jgi:hypothetical protein